MSDKDNTVSATVNDTQPTLDSDNATNTVTPNTGISGVYVMSEAEKKQRSRRNITIALMVIGFVVLVYMVTILRLGSSVLERGI